MIPKTIHFVWLGPPMPEWAAHNIAEFERMNPGYTVYVHSEAALLPEFGTEYGTLNGAEHEWARKADLVRLSVLYQRGGWYFDADFLPLRPLDDLYARYGSARFFLTRWTPTLIANGVIGAEPLAPELATLRRLARERMSLPIARSWDAFGPRLVTTLVEQCPEIVVGDRQDFYPAPDYESACHAYCAIRAGRQWQEVLKRWLPEDALPYMMHLFMQDRLELPWGSADDSGATGQ